MLQKLFKLSVFIFMLNQKINKIDFETLSCFKHDFSFIYMTTCNMYKLCICLYYHNYAYILIINVKWEEEVMILRRTQCQIWIGASFCGKV